MRTPSPIALATPLLAALCLLPLAAPRAQGNVVPPVIVIAPTAPPPPQTEVVPAPPSGQETVLVWQPGRWTWERSWEPLRALAPPGADWRVPEAGLLATPELAVSA
jgi:hypothetical protein